MFGCQPWVILPFRQSQQGLTKMLRMCAKPFTYTVVYFLDDKKRDILGKEGDSDGCLAQIVESHKIDKKRFITLPPTIMAVENGLLQD